MDHTCEVQVISPDAPHGYTCGRKAVGFYRWVTREGGFWYCKRHRKVLVTSESESEEDN